MRCRTINSENTVMRMFYQLIFSLLLFSQHTKQNKSVVKSTVKRLLDHNGFSFLCKDKRVYTTICVHITEAPFNNKHL